MDSVNVTSFGEEEVEVLKTDVTNVLTTVERYNSSNLPRLEEYVKCQAAKRLYDLEANLTVLKLYQLFPHFYKPEVAHIILLMAICNLPRNDFAICLSFLLGAHQFEDATIQRLRHFSNVLEMCQFETFWMEKAQDANIFNQVCGVDDSIRKFICGIINITYLNIKKSNLSELLGKIGDNEVNDWVKAYNWKEGAESIIHVCNQENRNKSTVHVAAMQTETPKSSKEIDLQFQMNPNFDVNPDENEEFTYDLRKRPSKEFEFTWIYVVNQHHTEKGVYRHGQSGKWMIFKPLDEIDETWNELWKAVHDGKLGSAAKVSTIKDSDDRSPYADESVICVYTYDHEDVSDVMRVRDALRDMGYLNKLPYKTDDATLSGKYRWKTGKRVSKYYL